MTQQLITTTPANTQRGDSPKAAFDKVNANFTEVYSLLPAGLPPIAVETMLLSAGANNNVQIFPTTGFLDFTAPSSASITGITAGFDGQEIIITNVGVPQVTVKEFNAGSIATNQIRVPFDITLTQNNSILLKYSVALGLWVGVI